MEEDRQLPDDLPTLVAEWGDTEGAQDQFVMVHRVRKFVSSAVQRIIGHVIVHRWMMVLQIRRSDILGLRGFCNISHKSIVENCSTHLEDSICLDFFCGATIDPAKEEDECEAHAAFLGEAEGFGVMDCGANTSFGSVEGAEALFSKINDNDTRIPDVYLCGSRSFNFGDGASSKATSLSRLPVRNGALGEFGAFVHLFSDQPEPTPLMLGMDFLKEHR